MCIHAHPLSLACMPENESFVELGLGFKAVWASVI